MKLLLGIWDALPFEAKVIAVCGIGIASVFAVAIIGIVLDK